MNGDPTDVLRSCRRYVSLILGSPPWTVRIGRVRAEDDARPVAVVDASSPLTTLFSRAGTVNQGDVRKGRTLTVVCYPPLALTAQDSAVVAEECAALLNDGFERGLVTDDVPAKFIGAPWRLPLYDFHGVPLTGDGRAGPVEPYGYANVTDTGFNVRPIQDAMDELRYTVVATVPLTWWRAGRIGREGPLIRDIPGTWGGSGAPQPNSPGTSVR